MNTILQATDIHKSFGRGEARNHVLRGLNLQVRRGEFLAVMGPSGCGKSTLLHILGLMDQPDRGEVMLDGETFSRAAARPQRLRFLREKIGFVFQRFNLIGVLSGRDNVRMSLHVRGRRDDEHVEALLDQMGVSAVAHRKPGELSIGEQQRIAVARALAHRPGIVLADEPTGNLDTDNGLALLDLLRRINRRDAQTIVMITHSAEASDRADRVLRMRDGIIKAE
ncbi:MAG: ABC transporter ATP-binding protein [Phycisphaerae bacterium]|nr:ABC transporter ATP-binding protein [Phycisphaerae bacterium]